MKTLPAILEEEGKLLKEQFGLYSNYADFCPPVESYVDFLLASHKRVLGEVTANILPKIQKFIDKVESGRARSKETYADMKEIKSFLSSLQEGITDTKV